jgi:two-component system sensor histidine kinase ChvG
VRLSLRSKLALVSLVLLVLPWVGYRYVREMEGFLLESRQQALLATAKAVATVLHERPALMRLSTPLRARQTEPPPAVTEDGDVAATVETAVPVEIGRASEQGTEDAVAEVARLLQGAARSDGRIWVVNRELKVLALAGSLKPPENAQPQGIAGRLAGWLMLAPARDFDDAIDDDVLANGRDITSALMGAPASRLRNSRDGRAVIVSAAHPVWAGDNVVGAVVAEETTNPILSLRNEALEKLLLLTVTAFAAVAVLLLGFATRLSGRIRRLRDEAEGALDARGRIAHLATASTAGDEIGDLSRSFSAMLAKLSQHHGYLESLASRLSHELRTPVAVVRSSLENLRLEGVTGEAQVYVDRAEEGLDRLSRILSRMSEATRLEASLAAMERERYDLVRVVQDCIEGYRLAYAGKTFDLTVPAGPAMVGGSPDLLAQLLDKLVSNAADFAAAGTPIRVTLEDADGMVRLQVANRGPGLPAAMAGKLFESMISVRPAAAGEPHLGLGLYVARLIAEFHGGRIAAADLPDGGGVAVTVCMPPA